MLKNVIGDNRVEHLVGERQLLPRLESHGFMNGCILQYRLVDVTSYDLGRDRSEITQ